MLAAITGMDGCENLRKNSREKLTVFIDDVKMNLIKKSKLSNLPIWLIWLMLLVSMNIVGLMNKTFIVITF